MPSTTLTAHASELARMGDVDVVEAIYGLVREKVAEDSVSGEFYWLLAEAFERFAPNVELELARLRAFDSEKPEKVAVAIDQYIEGSAARHVSRLVARAERQRGRSGGDA